MGSRPKTGPLRDDQRGVDSSNPSSPEMASHKPGRRIGYAWVSTDEQDIALQVDALTAAGCQRIFEDTAGGGAGPERSGWPARPPAMSSSFGDWIGSADRYRNCSRR